MPASITIETTDGVATARMMHGRANALDLEFCSEIVQTFEQLAADDVRAVVLTGSGSIFSAGVDLIRLQQDGPAYRDRFVPAISELVLALLQFPKPLIAAINGHAIAGGCVLACTADYRIMARGAGRIGVPELHVGVPYPVAALEAVRFAVPPQRLHEIVYGAATYAPDDALAAGLVDQLADAHTLLDEGQAAAARLGALPTHVFALTKRTLRAPVLANIAAGAALDAEITPVWKQDETLARIRTYVEQTFKRG